ncbi:MAG: hypothetical protein IT426_01330 [Pirellulales bacterium]|nr:hypothetical protein [Pirellulales bacterium]
MDESFDPYRKWLGIPPEEQPPHHYRLLGLELFEEDADVISNAADARLAFLRSLAKDKHTDMADRIATQIKEVQLCLLDPAKKAFYDGQLQRRVTALKKEPSAAAAISNGATILSPNGGNKWTSTPLPPQPSSMAGENHSPSSPVAANAIPELRIPTYTPPPVRAPRERWRLLAATMLGLVALGCLLVYLLVKYKKDGGTGEKPAVVRTDSSGDKSRAANSSPSTRRDDSPGGKPAENAANSTGDPEKHPPLKGGDFPIVPLVPDDNNSARMPGGNALDNVPPHHSSAEPARNADDSMPPKNAGHDASTSGEHNLLEEDFSGDVNPPPASQPAGERQPIPDETTRRTAEKSVREIYATQMAAAKNGMRKRALADRLWSQAIRTNNDIAARYALMSLAVQLLGDSDRVQSALDRVDAFAEYFAVNPWEMKLQAIAQAAKSAQAARDNAAKSAGDELVLLARQFAEQAKEAGQIEIADKTLKAVNPLAKKDPMLMREMNIFAQEIKRLMARYQPVRKALDALKQNPDDADANALAGRWTCFEERDWDEGLPMLAKSSDAPLAELAAKDIAASKNPAGPLAAADAWWDYAQKEKGSAKAAALARAEHWYDRALPNLAGLDQAKADSRLKTIAGFDASAAPGRGVIQTGNVALASNGTRVEGVAANADKLLDGESRNPGWDGAAASGPVPCEWTITFDKVYLLQQIRFHFYDGDARFYHYVMAVSADGIRYKTLIERNQGQSFRWQIIPVKGLPVKSVKLYGTLSYKNQVFSVTEFEAYCIPPKR